MIVLAYDHRGFKLMTKVAKYLTILGETYKVMANSEYDGADAYPEFAIAGNKEVLKNKKNFGIYCCRTGVGISIMANRTKGIRAGLCKNVKTTFLARNDDNINVLVISGEESFCKVKKMIKTFLFTPFEGGRHSARVEMFDE